MTYEALLQHASQVQRATLSAASCSSTTVESLTTLLAGPNTTQVQNGQAAQNSARQKASARAIKSSTAKPRGRPGTAAVENKEPHQRLLEPVERVKLATEVLNSTLKVLTETVKSQSNLKIIRQPKLPSAGSTAYHGRNITRGESPKPLQVRCANIISQSSSESSRSRRSSSVSRGPSIGIMALAECSRIALAALKKYGPLESTKPGSSTSMLDAAASHLISKLIALGMEDLAVKELRLLAGRLVKSKDRRETAAHDSGSTEAGKCETVSSGQQNLTDLLDFSGVASEFHNLDLIVTTQIQIIKIIASRRRPSSIEAALEHLRLSALYSPVNLIERGMKDQMKDTRNKAARQLEVLCQAIIMLLPSSSASGGCETIDPRKWPSPQVVLRYQHLILEIRQKLWSLSEHQIDLHKELISPFKKSLEVFIQRSGPPTLKILIRAKEATTSFAALVESVPIKLPIIHAIDLQRPLAVLACSLGQFDDAIQIFTRCQELSNSSASKARLCALSCQISSASLQKLAQLHEIELSVIQDTITLLKAEFQGNSEELDDLLVCASSLRKPATTLLTQGAKGGDGDIAPVSIDLQQACLEVLLAAVSFLKRYVGKDPLSTHESNAGLRYKQRTRLALAVIRPMIDSLASLSRLPLLNLDRAWRNLDLALQDCYSLCLDLQHSEAWNELPPNGTLPKNYFVLLSNAYWCCYLTKKAKSEPSQLRYLISKSISIIAERSPEEKEAGYLSIKLEKLGMLQESSGKWAESLGHYRKALKFELEAGILQSAAQSAASYPLSAALADTGRAGVFVRLLSAFLKVSQKIDNAEIDQPVVFDDDQVSDVQRGLLFEHQLESLVSLPGNAELPDRFWQTLTMLSNTLLQIYSKEKFPIRRLRVVVRLLHVYSTNRPILGSRFLDKLLETQACCTLPELGNDQGLQRYASNLLDRQILLSAVGRELVDVQALHKILGQWVRLVLSLPDWTTLQNKVDNPKDWISELHFLGEYLRMKGQEELCASVLQIVSRIHSLQFSTINAIQISNLSNLGLQLTRLGHTEEAGRILQKANGHIDDCDIPSTTLIRLHLAYAEYLLAIGNTVRCNEYAEKATKLVVAMPRTSTRARDRHEFIKITTELASLQSLLAFTDNKIPEALFHARRGTKLSYRLWALIERQKGSNESKLQGDFGTEMESVMEGVSAMSIAPPKSSPVTSMTHESLRSSSFWPLVLPLFQLLLCLSKLLSHHGLFAEARYYAEKALKIAQAVDARILQRQAVALLGRYSLCGNRIEHGLKLFDEIAYEDASLSRSIVDVSIQLDLASGFLMAQDRDRETAAFTMASDILQGLQAGALSERNAIAQEGNSDVPSKPKAMTSKAKSGPRPKAPQTKTKPVIKPSIRSPAEVDAKSTSSDLGSESRQCNGHLPILRMEADVLRHQAQSELRRGNIDAAETWLALAKKLPALYLDTLYQSLATAQLLLARGLADMASDPVFSVIADSVISCPSAAFGGRRRSKDISKIPEGETENGVLSRKTKASVGIKGTRRIQASQTQEFVQVLSKSLEELLSSHVLAQRACSSRTTHVLSDVLTKTLVVLNAACPTNSPISVGSGFAVYAMELGRISAMRQERSYMEVEKLLDIPASGDMNEEMQPTVGLDSPVVDFVSFQAEYIDIIPETWTVLSISINENRDELRLARLRANQAPFILTIPLHRHNSRDLDEEIFGFDEGKEELLNVISLANYSTHDAVDASRKDAKIAWWEARKALDARLKDLLTNIENIWLGGFRGIFEQRVPPQNLLSRFQQSFYNILEKHLPSRRKGAKGTKQSRVSLDSRVLELFTGLGKPAKVEYVEEPLTDLLYFVVDILQFHGERNAYDEIDFDSIVVETMDALTQFHEALQDRYEGAEQTHAVLILDKSLHCFPWESLPCMAGRSVSRLPSLGCLRTRILRQPEPKTAGQLPGLYADPTDGAYVLNPAGDLASTQKTFMEPLAALGTWSATVNAAPSEAELVSHLASRSLYLYFGHGCGGQYIRARAIKRLEGCAVALLMGCSSGALTEAGEYESYGTPINYLQAGSAAVVGTLWDVTDKDIDRFSMTVLERWGLFEHEAAASPAMARGSPAKRDRKGKGKEFLCRGKVSLDQAVAEGRSSCILKHLNGAAPVVYGVPVYLSP